MTALPLDRLEAACLAVRNINLDSAEVHTVGEIVCPLCGDGSVNVETWTNIDEKPVGIEVFGVGNALTDYETFLREANPATILDLIQALRLSEAGKLAAEAALKEIDQLEVMEINPNNYDHDLVCALSNNAAQAAVIARNALKPSSEHDHE